MWKLVIEDDEGKRTVVPLTRDEYTIGRKEGNSIRLTERNVSRDHAKLTRKPGSPKDKPVFILADLTSYNGVYSNGLRVADKQDLSHGDLIQIGDYRIVLEDEALEAPGPEEEAIPIDPEDLRVTASVAAPSPLRATNATFLEKPNRLVVLAGPNPGEEFPLVGDRLTIGRAEDASISVNHNSVSRLHCEVHALGDARFEIVDKGSSNGVRVNGADLRRGIIEAGDIIELGDVKFKFVGQGQLFRPGSSESQQLAALSPRSATAVVQVRSSGKSALVPAILIGTVLALAFIAALLLKNRPTHTEVSAPEMSSSASIGDTTGADTAMLADARRMSDVGDVEGAHVKASQLPATSPLHASGDFKYIESSWASSIIFQSDSEPDPNTKAALLKRLISDTYADPTTRRVAGDRLAAIDFSPPHDGGKRGSATGSSHASASPSPGGNHGANPLPAPAVADPGARPTPHAPPPQVSLTDLASSANPADWDKARAILEPRVFAHRGSGDDVRMLMSICKNQHDANCVSELKTLK